MLVVLRACTTVGPYEKAAEEYEDYGTDSEKYQEYVREPDYVGHYEKAVRLSAVYITALYEVYTTLKAGGDFTDNKKRFLAIVSNADLSCPLQKDILRKAQAALTSPKSGGARFKPVFAKARK